VAKLYFRYGAMNSGKSTAMLQTAYNYEERGQRVLIAKPAVDTKGDTNIVSRLGVNRAVDFLVAPETRLREEFLARRDLLVASGAGALNCLLIDEAQFLTPAQVDDALRIAILDDVPVLAYGIRTDFQTVAFPGSARLMEISHSLEELKTICRCGRKAIFNSRKIDDLFVFDGDQVAIDGEHVTYESLCGACYLAESDGALGSPR
jgi:thymidine kinase